MTPTNKRVKELEGMVLVLREELFAIEGMFEEAVESGSWPDPKACLEAQKQFLLKTAEVAKEARSRIEKKARAEAFREAQNHFDKLATEEKNLNRSVGIRDAVEGLGWMAEREAVGGESSKGEN